MTAGKGQLVAVQAGWPLEAYRDRAAFQAHVERLMQRVAAVREPGLPALVAFPEFVGLPLLFLDTHPVVGHCTRWTEAVLTLAGGSACTVGAVCQELGVGPLRALFLSRAERMRTVYLETFSEAARRHRCMLVAGSIPLPDFAGDPAAVYNTSFLFGSDGSLLGSQGKLHPYGLEGSAEGLDITPAPPPVRAFDTDLGRVGIAVCYDAFQPDVVDALAEQGAAIVVQPTANAHAWDAWQVEDWRRGLWSAIQRHPGIRYGVNPMMVGAVFSPSDEYACEGRSSILGKGEATPDGSGILAQATEQEGPYLQEEVVCATVPLA